MRPSDGWELDELREEFDWMYKFNARMAEKIRGDANVHNLADYVGKLERENEELRELCSELTLDWMSQVCPTFPYCTNNGEYEHCNDKSCGNLIYKETLQEMGIEVDG